MYYIFAYKSSNHTSGSTLTQSRASNWTWGQSRSRNIQLCMALYCTALLESYCLAFLADTRHGTESSRLCKASDMWEWGCRKRVWFQSSLNLLFILWLWVTPPRNKRKYGGRMVWLSRRWALCLNFSSQCLFQVWLKILLLLLLFFLESLQYIIICISAFRSFCLDLWIVFQF